MIKKIVYSTFIFCLLFGFSVTFAHSVQTFDNNLSWSTPPGEEVSRLQQFLKDQGYYTGLVTGNFLFLTRDAVKLFQLKNGIEPSSGYVGPMTRAKINSILQSHTHETTSVTGSSTSNFAAVITSDMTALQERISALLAEISAIQSQIENLRTQQVGKRVKTTSTVNVRQTANSRAIIVGRQSSGAVGTILAGPINQNSYTWWNINYDSGVDGWTADANLVINTEINPTPTPNPVTPPTPLPTPTPVPNPTPTPVTPPSPTPTPVSTTTNPMPMPMPTPVPPPTPTSTTTAMKIWGVVDPVVLGECSEAVHDKYMIDGGDGFYYRTWHPQVDPSGCVFAHEHGMDPNSMTDSWVRANWDPRFGYASRRMPMPGEPDGHIEAHEGYKVFVANIGDINDEGRVNKTASLSTVHMGTGGPKRFSIQHHSNSIAYKQGNIYAATHLLLDTGGVAGVCDPRVQAPTKDGLVLGTCKVNSPYEIWSMTQTIKNGNREIYRGFATPAVFDPITAFNPANPTELVYAWDPRISSIKNFNNDWSGHRGCDRESYAQLGYFYNGNGPTEYWTDPMGNVVPQTAPNAIKQVVAQSNVGGNPPFSSDIAQFKKRVSLCQNKSKLGLKN